MINKKGRVESKSLEKTQDRNRNRKRKKIIEVQWASKKKKRQIMRNKKIKKIFPNGERKK